MNNKETLFLPLFCNWGEITRSLSDAEFGKVVRALLVSVEEGREIDTNLNLNCKIAYNFMLDGANRVIEAQRKKSESQREKALKRWSAAKEQKGL